MPTREVMFFPYRNGAIFCLEIEAVGRGDYGRHVLRYKLDMRDHEGNKTLFEGRDFSHASRNPIGDSAVEGVMGFLTLRLGDTDDDYFANYTPAQLAFAAEHAEALSLEVMAMFCDENGDVINRD